MLAKFIGEMAVGKTAVDKMFEYHWKSFSFIFNKFE